MERLCTLCEEEEATVDDGFEVPPVVKLLVRRRLQLGPQATIYRNPENRVAFPSRLPNRPDVGFQAIQVEQSVRERLAIADALVARYETAPPPPLEPAERVPGHVGGGVGEVS